MYAGQLVRLGKNTDEVVKSELISSNHELR